MARTGIACRVHTGFAAQGIDFQSRVVAEAVIAVMLLDVAGLHLGIALDDVGSFGDILVAAYIGQTKHFIQVANHLAEFLQLVDIIGSKNYLLHIIKMKNKKTTNMMASALLIIKTT